MTRTGAVTLRHLFALILGLGMRESSGRYCEGRDMSASNVSAETAECGSHSNLMEYQKLQHLHPATVGRLLMTTKRLLEVFQKRR